MFSYCDRRGGRPRRARGRQRSHRHKPRLPPVLTGATRRQRRTDQRERLRSSRPSGATDTVYRVRGPGGWDGQVGLQSLQTHCAPKKPVAASELTSQEVWAVSSGFLLFLAGRLPVHFSTVFPLERRDMVMGGAAERRLQASHRHRCTWWRAMVPPWCIHSLVRSLVCRVDRRPAAASDLRRWLGGRCELPHEDDWVSSAGSRAQQTNC